MNRRSFLQAAFTLSPAAAQAVGPELNPGIQRCAQCTTFAVLGPAVTARLIDGVLSNVKVLEDLQLERCIKCGAARIMLAAHI
jgi:hypothetical protein